MKCRSYILFMVALFSLAGCKPSQYLKRSELKVLDEMLHEENMNHHFGFLLKKLSSGQIIKSLSPDKYYTPASNTKVLSLALGLKVLGDSIPFINYYNHNDTLFVQGLGDPTFLHPEYNSERNIKFLQSFKVIVLDQSNFKDERYGRGWSWDDYNGAYQIERSSFPVYGNMVSFIDEVPSIPFFDTAVVYKMDQQPLFVQRDRRNNFFSITGAKGENRKKQIPLVISDQLVRELLQDTLKIPVVEGTFNKLVESYKLYSHHVDSLYTPMMQRSDNFFADQIVLMASQEQVGYMNEVEIIDWAKENLFNAPDELLWFDGSGLSRYNQITARSMVYLFEKLEREFGLNRILPILAQGGVSGTIEDWYAGGNEKDHAQPFVFAKTGTIRNVHCLSGYLKSESGNWYVFSFMHNNFPGASSSVKKPMEKILNFLKSNL